MDELSRPRITTLRGRLLLGVGLISLVGAAAFGIAAVGSRSTDAVVLDVESAVAVDIPATVPPVSVRPISESLPEDSASAGPDVTAPATTNVTTVVPTVPPLSPLADLIGQPGSALPEPIEPRSRPLTLTIPDTNLWAPIRAVGLEDDGQLEVPGETEVGWYQYGSAPGRPGATVLAAHVTWNDTIGPFYRLGDLDPGARVEVNLDDGATREYEVVERTMYDKDSLPRDRIWRTTGDESLVLITCGGSFNPDIGRYRQNIVVYAVPVA